MNPVSDMPNGAASSPTERSPCRSRDQDRTPRRIGERAEDGVELAR